MFSRIVLEFEEGHRSRTYLSAESRNKFDRGMARSNGRVEKGRDRKGGNAEEENSGVDGGKLSAARDRSKTFSGN